MWYLYVGNDKSLANFGNVSDDFDQSRYSTSSFGNVDCTSALWGMFGISGLHRQNAQTNLVTNKTMKNYKKTGVQILVEKWQSHAYHGCRGRATLRKLEIAPKFTCCPQLIKQIKNSMWIKRTRGLFDLITLGHWPQKFWVGSPDVKNHHLKPHGLLLK